jgi:hypothetical protein
MRVYKHFLMWVASLLMTACSANPIPLPTSTPLPSIQVRLDPLLEWSKSAMQMCSRQIPERNWVIVSADDPLSTTGESTVHIYWGSETNGSQNTFLLTSEHLVIVVNPTLPVTSLSLAELQDIFSGKINRWDEIAEDLPAAEIEVWYYPPNLSIMENFFRWSGLSSENLSPLGLFAPHPLELRNAIAENPLAIGILTTRWMDDTVEGITIEGNQNTSEFPVLAAVTTSDAFLQEWLFCLQNQIR